MIKRMLQIRTIDYSTDATKVIGHITIEVDDEARGDFFAETIDYFLNKEYDRNKDGFILTMPIG